MSASPLPFPELPSRAKRPSSAQLDAGKVPDRLARPVPPSSSFLPAGQPGADKVTRAGTTLGQR